MQAFTFRLFPLFFLILFSIDLMASTHSTSRPLEIEQIHYSTYGDSNNVPMVLIHGLGSSGDTFKPMIDELSKHFYVVTYDQRGHGKTQDVGFNYSSKLLAEDLLQLVNYLGLGKFHLLGHSMGARTAMRFAQLYPDRVHSVVIEDMELIKRHKINKNNVLKRATKLKEIPSEFPSQKEFIETLSSYFDINYARRCRNHLTIEKGQITKVTLVKKPYVEYLYGIYGTGDDLSMAPKDFGGKILVLKATKGGSGISAKGLENFSKHDNVKIVEVEDSQHSIHNSNKNKFLDLVISFIQEGELN